MGMAQSPVTTLPTSPLCFHISVKPSEAPKELIIPLIQSVHHRLQPTHAPGSSTDTKALVYGVLSQAVKELSEGE